jgi:Cupin superfamily protein
MVGTAFSSVFDLDPQRFAAGFGARPMGVDHSLVDDPLLTLDAIADLAERFPGRVERHRSDLPMVMPGGAPELEMSPADMVRGIEENNCWMVFWYVDQDPAYKGLLDRCLDEAETYLPAGAGAAIQREAFLFLSAPNAVTPIHFDPEHNFLLQIRGHKDMNVCAFPSPEVANRELDRYHDNGERNLGLMPSEGEKFGLDPGQGVYVPSFMPHWVQNGPHASVSLSITFRTRASLRSERVHRINARLRSLRMSPTPAGASPIRDFAKESVWITLRGSQRRVAVLKQALGGTRNAPPAG